MTREQLHAIPHFAKLFTDERFVAAMIYMRQHPRPRGNTSVSEPTAIIRSEGAWQSWFECLEQLEKLEEPPKPSVPPKPGKPYSQT